MTAVATAWLVRDLRRTPDGQQQLLVTPGGVLQRDHHAETAASWASIVNIVPGYERSQPYLRLLVEDSGTTRFMGAAPPLTTIFLEPLHSDPTLVYRLLRYYHRHPEARAELGTPECLRRLERRELVDASDRLPSPS